MRLFTIDGFRSAHDLFKVTEGVHHQAIALRLPCHDNNLKRQAQRVRAEEHLIA